MSRAALAAAIPFLLALAAVARPQESAAPFDAPLVTLGRYDRYALLTDLDQDGFQDAVSWWWTSPDIDRVRLRAWRNDGTGRLVSGWTTVVLVNPQPTNSAYSFRILPCEVDADGLTDFCLVYGSSGVATIRVLRSQGLSAPELLADYSIDGSGTGYQEVHAVVADFTGDGLADLATSIGGNLQLLEYVPGYRGLLLRSSTYPFGSAGATVQGLMEIDANGDATPDLLAWRGVGIQLIEVEACQPSATQTYVQGIAEHHMPAPGDLDGDGDEDLVIWDMTRFVVARRTGPSAWSIEPPVTGGPAEFLVDVDQDGDLDGVCCGSGDPSTPENIGTSIMRVSVNDGTGLFAPALEFDWLGSDHLAGIADLDHDGDLDVVAGRCILYARGPLTQTLHPSMGSQQTERTTADVDGDSDPDFTVGMRPLQRNLGEGRCTSYTPSFPGAPTGTQFVGPGWPGDFDGDGDMDLVVKHHSGSTFLEQRLLRNRGGGAFEDAGPAGPSGVDFAATSTQGNRPEASLAADADGDGDVDLITRGWTGNAYRSLFWWNDGAGTFTAGPALTNEYVNWVGDLTGDGIPELTGWWLAYPGASYGNSGWNEGLGGGAFGSPVQLGSIGGGLEASDLDADGDRDLALASSLSFRVFWNEGGGAFTPESVTSVAVSNASSGQRTWSTDVNGDGRRDLLISSAEHEPNGVIVLLRKADNSGWETPFAQIVFSSYTSDAVLVDVDGDGDRDFVTDRLIRSATYGPPDGGRRRQIGAGAPGTGGLVPTLGARGPFRLGEVAELRVTGGIGGATGLLTITLVDDGPPGATPRGMNGGWIAPGIEPILAQIPVTLSGPSGVPGAGSWSRARVVSPGFVHQTRRYVLELDDAGAPNGVARANEMLITYGD